MTDLVYSPLTNSASGQAWAVRKIYEASFEDDERVDFDGLYRWLTTAKEDYRSTLGAFLNRGDVVGFGSAVYYLRQEIGYLAYLAVRKELRGRGYGFVLIRHLLEWVQETARSATDKSPRMTFWEVRDPADAPDEDERKVRLRRINFYSRFGAFPTPIHYLCPPIGPGLSPVPFVPMVYTYPPGRALSRQDALDLARLGLVVINNAAPESHYWAGALQSIDEHWPE